MGPPSPPALLTACLTLLLLVGLCRTSVSRCPEGYYRDGHSHRCQSCSTCPVNQIIRRPCAEESNTQCGPFSEFLEFHQAPRPSVEVGDLPLPDEEGGIGVMDTRGKDDNRSRKLADELLASLDDRDDPEDSRQRTEDHQHQRGSAKDHHNHHHHHRHGQDREEAAKTSDPLADPGESPGRGLPGVTGSPGQPEAPSLHEGEEGERQWKVLALALIVVLCIVCIFLIVFVFVICYMRSRRAHLKQVLYTASADKGAASRPPAGQRPRQSTMHYVPVLTHAQARTGTSGGAMTAALPGGLVVDSSYLYSEDYDADNSGQTISTTKSSDYVYFKSPHNGNNVIDEV